MKGLFWSSKPNLQSVHKMEPAVCAQRERIHAALAASLIPVTAYIATYGEYRPVLKLDPHAFVKEFEAAEHSLDMVHAPTHTRMHAHTHAHTHTQTHARTHAPTNAPRRCASSSQCTCVTAPRWRSACH
jgi:hypothetical protein